MNIHRNLLVVSFLALMLAALSASASTSRDPKPAKVGCTCNPACNTNQWCCSTANGGCGCFPFSC